jgi:hypothetical protein
VSAVVETIGKKMNLKNSEEFTLKYDGKDQWLNATQSLTEQGLAENDAVVLKKRFFVNDANVDRSDPVQLHLVYAQCKNSILAGDHPLSPAEAGNLGALECQIVQGNYNPAVHKPGSIDAKMCLPPQYHDKKGGVEGLLMAEYKKLVGMTEINAKFRYVSDTRKLKTYGITSFEVGTRVPDKKKPLMKRLGITRDAVLIMEGETRAIEREFPLTHLRRWAAAPKTFTLDFGDYEDDYFTLLTNEGEAISQLIGGYIDILLKKRKDAARVIEDDGLATADVSDVGGVRGGVTKGQVVKGRAGMGGDGALGGGIGGAGQKLEYVQGPYGQQILVSDLANANRAIMQMLDEAVPNGDVSMLNAQARSQEEWRRQMLLEAEGAKKQSAELQKLLESPNGGDAALLNAAASKLGGHTGALLNCARLASMAADGDPALLDSARLLAAAVAKMLANANDVNQNPNDPEARLLYASAREEFDATQAMLNACCNGRLADEADQRLLIAAAKAVAVATSDMLRGAEASSAAVSDPKLRAALLQKAKQGDELGGRLLAVTRTLAPTIVDQDCQGQLMNVSRGAKGGTGALLAAAKAAGLGGEDYKNLLEGAKSVSDAIAALMAAAQAPEARQRGDAELQAAVYRTVQAAQGVGDAAGKPKELVNNTKLMAQAGSRLMALAKARAQAMHDQDERNALLEATKALAAATQALVDSAKAAAQAPADMALQNALRGNAAELEARARHLGKVGNRGGALQLLRSNAKYATAATTELRAAVASSRARTGDVGQDNQLLAAAKVSADAMARLLAAVYACDQNSPQAFNQLADTAKQCVGEAFPLVAHSKRVVPAIRDAGGKQLVQLTSNEAQTAIKRLMDSTKVERGAGSEDFDDAFAILSEDAALLDQLALSAAQRQLRPSGAQSKENALAQLLTHSRQLGQAAMETAKAANTVPQLGARAKAAAETSSQVSRSARALAESVDDNGVQVQVLERAKTVNATSMDMVAAATQVADDPSKDNKVALAQAAKANAGAVAELCRLAKTTEANGVDLALAELDKSAAQLNESPAAVGGDFKTPAAQLVSAANAVEAAARALEQAAALKDRNALDQAGRQMAQKLPLLVTAANAAAAAAPEDESRDGIVRETRGALDETRNLLHGAKRGQACDAQPVADALAAVASQCDVLTPDERTIAAAMRAFDQAASEVRQAPSMASGGAAYGSAAQSLSATTKALLQAMSRLQAAGKSGPQDMPAAFTGVAQAMQPFVQAYGEAAAVAPAEARAQFDAAARDIGAGGSAFLRQAQAVYKQPRDNAAQAGLASEYKNAAVAVRAMVGAIDTGATGAKAADDAIAQLERLLQELTSGVFQVRVDGGATFDGEVAAAARAAPSGADAARAFASLAVGDQAGVGDTASQCAAAATAIAEATKRATRIAATSDDADDKRHQVELNGVARALLSALRDTLRAGKAYQANSANQKAADAMRAASAGAAKHAQALQQLAAAAGSAMSANDGERSLTDAQAQLRNSVQQFKSGAYAGVSTVKDGDEADEVTAAARQVAAEAAGLATASDHAAVRDAAFACVAAAEQLLQRTAAVAPTAADAPGRNKLNAASAAAVESLVKLCEAGKERARKPNNPTVQRGVNDAAAQVAHLVNDVVSATETLPKKVASIESGENLEELAEQELANCAKEIARAAAELMAKPSRARGAMDAFEEVADAILDATQEIAEATQQLIIAATQCQKEISAQSGGKKSESVYMKDPAWARGLISAAQSVGGNVKLLVAAANKAAQGNGQDTELVACGRGVAAATVRLITASRAKGDPFSPSQQNLSNCGKNVQRATDKLVVQAGKYAEVTEKETDSVDIDSLGAVGRMRLQREKESELAALEAELAAAQSGLLNLQKSRYKDAGAK